MALKPGDEAPDFERRSHRGGTIKLPDLRGRKNVVLAFHPLAFTPVCADQMCSYQSDLSHRCRVHSAMRGGHLRPGASVPRQGPTPVKKCVGG